MSSITTQDIKKEFFKSKMGIAGIAILTILILTSLITIIIIQSAITKSIFEIIQKTDHKIWRKTGKDSYIANKIWWLQQKWVGLDKRMRAMIIIQFLIAFISWRYFFLMN